MSLVVVVVLAALVLGRLGGGRLSRLGTLTLRSWPLVPLAAGVQLAGAVAGAAGLPAGPSYAVGLAASAVLVGVFLARNRQVPGVGLVMLGLLLNALVVGVNGAMPVSIYAAARAGVATGALGAVGDGRHELVDADTRLVALGDVVPVPLPLRPEVVSIGDALLASGFGLLVAKGMCRPQPDAMAPSAHEQS